MGSVSVLLWNRVSSQDLGPFKGYVEVDIAEVVKRQPNMVLVYDSSMYLPFWTLALEKAGWHFRYHIVVYFESFIGYPLRSHVAIGVYYKDRLQINKVRVPHKKCAFCGDWLKDYGGKKHLMHPEGAMLSDVWRHLELTQSEVLGEGLSQKLLLEVQKLLGDFTLIPVSRKIYRDSDRVEEENKVNSLEVESSLIVGDCVEVLSELPDNCIDMIFVDPPYNLGKAYKDYKDKRDDYKEWTIRWLKECFRVLKPQGSLFYLNIPQNAHSIVPELLKDYWLVDWFVWESAGEPRGKLIPAHYSLLWFSKSPHPVVYSLPAEQDSDRYCLRGKCKAMRKLLQVQDKIEVCNVRWDIHRVKHSSKRLDHPTQLPEKLCDFLIRLTTKEGDMVLDPMMGVGVFPYTAKLLGRRFIGIDISSEYVLQAKERLLNETSFTTYLKDKGRKKLSKKQIQIKVGELAFLIRRLPTLQEISDYLEVSQKELLEMFGSYSRIVKYAKLIIQREVFHGNLSTFSMGKVPH